MIRTALAVVLLGLALLGGSAVAYGSSSAGGGGLRMGTPSTISRKAFQGYYDGHRDTYLNTDVSDKAEAAAMHVNYAPVLKSVPLASAPEIYLVKGRPADSSRSSAPSRARRATRRSGKRPSSPGRPEQPRSSSRATRRSTSSSRRASSPRRGRRSGSTARSSRSARAGNPMGRLQAKGRAHPVAGRQRPPDRPAGRSAYRLP